MGIDLKGSGWDLRSGWDTPTSIGVGRGIPPRPTVCTYLIPTLYNKTDHIFY